MSISRRQFVGGAGIAAAALAACGKQEEPAKTDDGGQQTQAASTLALNETKWEYDADDDVYYQLSLTYCERPVNENYQKLAILVPGAYFTATDNGDGTYTCKKNDSGQQGSFTAATAPIVMPINTPGYSAQDPITAYKSQADYTNEGFVYVHAGCRGRDDGAPAGVTDLKAAVRYLRQVASNVPGNMDRIFTFGMSGGGAQSALMGATGDAQEYAPYLSAIGAAGNVSDAVCGSMDWCPITGLDVADAAYEWMMGSTREDLSNEESGISKGLAEAYAAWVNAAGIVDDEGSQLKLEQSGEGVYQAGSYYECVRKTIEESLDNFLADTEFPYEAQSSGGRGQGGPREARDMQQMEVPDDGKLPDEALPEGDADAATEGEATPGNDMRSKGPLPNTGGDEPSQDTAAADQAGAGEREANGEQPAFEEMDNIARNQNEGGVSLSGTYQTAADYIAALNADGEWVTYDESSNTVSILSVADFCAALKRASKSLGAFDQLDRSQGENTLFGTDGNPLHFDAIMAGVLESQGNSYAKDYKDDLGKKDAQGTAVEARVAMYTPLYYLLASSAGFGKSTPAQHWRIRSGINQGDTALATELNLALALKAYSGVKSVDFATVWGQGHTQAERTGSSTENFIAWVKECLAG